MKRFSGLFDRILEDFHPGISEKTEAIRNQARFQPDQYAADQELSLDRLSLPLFKEEDMKMEDVLSEGLGNLPLETPEDMIGSTLSMGEMLIDATDEVEDMSTEASVSKAKDRLEM